MANRYLVVGGAGFIGSHLVAGLIARGDEVVVFDNLQTGHRAAIDARAHFHHGDLADPMALHAVFTGRRFDGVFHLADLSLVGESMQSPMRYLTINPSNAGRLIDACLRHGVQRLVYSSTANLFGTADTSPIGEDAPIAPASAYGESKFAVERMLLWAERVHQLHSACLRFFNAAGCDPGGRLGEAHFPETHLIPLAIDAALGRRPPLAVFGTDYSTPDGTCLRDYVHVTDLVAAHVLAMQRIAIGSVRYNIGMGRGHSVREVIDAVSRIAGRRVPVIAADRRPGDPPILIASADRIIHEMGWNPAYSTLDDIIETALIWRRNHPDGYANTAMQQRQTA
ncbi:MAG: UDP-glucose 4-epimerase GalE [Acetobacteraceae bacterium]|nr:UDP-glucose 4-epimerase GalE [Acetobacteraceae bacterium]